MRRLDIFIHQPARNARATRRNRDAEGATLIGGGHRPEGVYAKNTPILAADAIGGITWAKTSEGVTKLQSMYKKWKREGASHAEAIKDIAEFNDITIQEAEQIVGRG